MKGSEPGKNVLEIEIVVKKDDIDHLGHVNNAVYLKYVQEAAQAHWDNNAHEEIKKKYYWVVLRHEADYYKPAFEGDIIEAKTWVESMEGVKSIRKVNLYCNNKLIAAAKTTWCLMDLKNKKPTRITEELKEIFKES